MSNDANSTRLTSNNNGNDKKRMNDDYVMTRIWAAKQRKSQKEESERKCEARHALMIQIFFIFKKYECMLIVFKI